MFAIHLWSATKFYSACQIHGSLSPSFQTHVHLVFTPVLPIFFSSELNHGRRFHPLCSYLLVYNVQLRLCNKNHRAMRTPICPAMHSSKAHNKSSSLTNRIFRLAVKREIFSPPVLWINKLVWPNEEMWCHMIYLGQSWHSLRQSLIICLQKLKQRSRDTSSDLGALHEHHGEELEPGLQ